MASVSTFAGRTGRRSAVGAAGSAVGRRLQPWLLPAALLLVWEIVARAAVLPTYVLPSPTQVVGELAGILGSDTFPYHAGISLRRVLYGFVSGGVAGTLLGGLVGASALARRILDPTFQGLRTVPLIAWIPLFVLWLGVAEAPKVTLISLGTFFPVYLNLSSGIARVDRKLIEVGRVNRLHGWRLVLAISLPASLPSYFVGLRTGIGLSWMFLAAAELMGASEGIGYLLLEGQQVGKPDVVIACAGIFAVCGKTSDLAIAALARRLLAWQDTVEER